ncbi:MAG: hypothetical protein IKB01_02475 [Lachnospiraceae bacterium]|nr:hypothetical protein [Lachnospiraceae bacterium]
MKKQMLKRIAAAVLCCLVAVTSGEGVSAHAADGNSYVYDGYVYDFWGEAQECPAAFSLGGVIDSDSLAYGFGSIDDVCTSKDGRIFLADKTNARVNVFDEKGGFLKTIQTIYAGDKKIALNEDGTQVKLAAPSGTYYHDKNDELYIADSTNKILYVLDGQTYYLKRMIGQPDNLSGVTEYVPSKVTVDMADRIYIVVQSSYEGIIELNEDGSFSRYFGVNEPGVNLIEFFWKSIATDTQKEKMGKIYAPAFTNVVTDSEGFVYAVTNDSAAVDSVFRLNSKGENVLREMGGIPVIGDLTSSGVTSSFIDVAVTEYGVYAVLDNTKGRIFLYDYDGQVLNVFGGYGKTKGQFSKPTSIAWNGYNLVVTDTDLRCAYILNPTDFGQVMLRASEEYYNGNWDAATELFRECIRWNSNYEVAYVGIGKNHLMKDEYEDAMYYFKLGNARTYYSDAYNGYRGEQIRDNFWIIALLFIVGISALILSEVRYHKKSGAKEGANR